MAVTLKADGNSGRVAIYTGSGDAPLFNPIGNIGRVLFHSSLEYPAIKQIRTGVITLPARGANGWFQTAHNLFAHGEGGFPMVLGRITNLAGDPALVGSFPIQWQRNGFARWISLGANSTHVILHEQCSTAVGISFGAVAVAWEVYVFDILLGGSGSFPSPTAYRIRITPTFMEAGRGKFRSDRRYMRAASAGARFPLPSNQTITIGNPQSTGSGVWAYSNPARFSLYTQTQAEDRWGLGVNVDTKVVAPPNYAPPYRLVKL